LAGRYYLELSDGQAKATAPMILLK